jgi:hypothetical protein
MEADPNKIGDSSQASPREEPADHQKLFAELSAMAEFSMQLLSARLDEIRVRARRAVAFWVYAAVSFAMGGLVVLLSVIYVMLGLAGALTAAAGGATWVGNLGAGAIGLGAVLCIVAGRHRLIALRRMRERVRKFELRKARQRARFGRDAQEAARDAA